MKGIVKLFAGIIWAVLYGFFLSCSPASAYTLIWGLPVCYWLSNIVHETGHLLSYLFLKLRWRRFTLGCFIFEQGQGFRLDPSRKLFSAGCSCAYDSQVSLWRYTVALLSGGALCCVFSIVSILLSLRFGGWPAGFFLCFGIACGVNGAVNLLIPLSPDRMLLKQIIKERR